jgi:trehalose-6-phosphate synthase
MDLDERKRRHRAMAAVLRDQTPQRWERAFLDRLARARRGAA